MPGFPLRAGDSVVLMWMPFPGATSYVVYRGETPGGPYQKAGDVQANNYSDLNVNNEKTFYYVVKAVVGGKEGDPSPEAVLKGVEPMVPPKIENHLETEDNKIAIRWSAVPKAAFYNVYRSEKGAAGLALLASVQDTRFTDGKVVVGKTYTYALSSVSPTNVESKKSAPYEVRFEKKVAVASKSAVVKKTATYVDMFDVDEAAKIALKVPRGVASDGKGNFFVVDGSGKILYVSAKDLKVISASGKRPADFQGEWGSPEGIAFDEKAGELYICFPAVNAIRVYKPDGEKLREFGLQMPDPKTAPGMTSKPRPNAIALGGSGKVYVVDTAYYQVVILGTNGKELGRIGLPKSNPDRNKGNDRSLVGPGAIMTGIKGEVYVTENIEQRIAMFDESGKFLRNIGSGGAGPGMFLGFGGLAVMSDGTLLVADAGTERVQAFDAGGGYKATYIDPKVKDPQKQDRIAPSASGLAVFGRRIFVSAMFLDKVTFYDLAE